MPKCCAISLATKGTTSEQLLQLDNVLSFTTDRSHIIFHSAVDQPRIVVRPPPADPSFLSREHVGQLRMSRDLFAALKPHIQQRVTFNKQHLAVIGKHSPSVLAIHLSNFEVCRAERRCGGAIKFVLLSSNNVLIRPGLEEYVLAHSFGYCGVGRRCGSLMEGMKKNFSSSGIERWRTAVGRVAPRNQTSIDVAPEDDAHVRHLLDDWFRPVVRLLHRRTAGKVQVGIHSHEGSFYPCHMMASFVNALKACGQASQPAASCSNTAEAPSAPQNYMRGFMAAMDSASIPMTQNVPVGMPVLMREKKPRAACEHLFSESDTGCAYTATASSTSRSISMSYACLWQSGACAFEEFLLPTFARTMYAHLLPASGPPFVLHLWLKLANVKRQIGGLRELNRLVAHVSEDARTRHVFGVKVPGNPYPVLECAIAPFMRRSWASDKGGSLVTAVREATDTCGLRSKKAGTSCLEEDAPHNCI